MAQNIKRVGFVLTSENQHLLDTYYSYAPKGFVLNLSKLLNDLLATHLNKTLIELEQQNEQQ